MLQSTLTTFIGKGTNGRGFMYLPKGNSRTAGVKWYQDTISASVLGFKTEYQDKLKLIDQTLWDAIVEKYAIAELVTDIDLSDCFFFDVTIHDLAFQKVNFTNCRFSQCKIENAQFNNCNFSNATIYDDWCDCTFENCNFSESHICQTHFRRCSLANCDLTNSRVRHCLFYSCTLRENEFLGVQMDTVYIRSCSCLENSHINQLYITMGGATSDEVKAHSKSILNALTA